MRRSVAHFCANADALGNLIRWAATRERGTAARLGISGPSRHVRFSDRRWA